MAKRAVNNLKLGAFVLGGLVFLVLLLYMIGKNQDLFGNTYVLKARFENIQGLVSGNNVRFSGIRAGTVKRVKILNDTVIEVTMLIEKKMKTIIRKNAVASIGTDGLVGNKVVNISPAKQPAPLAAEGDILITRKAVNTDDMLQTLYNTNNDVAVIATELKSTIQRLNNSTALWEILNDKSIPQDLRMAVANLRTATGKAGNMVDNFNSIATDVKSAGDNADKLAVEINKVVAGISRDLNNGSGAANALLKDSMMVIKLNTSLDNIQQGTDGFNQNMEALKHNIFFRRYFKKLEKKKQKTGNINSPAQ
jgi:phospholipid/cholesterol/gamma-HCH transport system substrate-binding protein